MKYIKFLSLAAIIVTLAGAGVKFYTSSKSQQQISQVSQVEKAVAVMEQVTNTADSAEKTALETFTNVAKEEKNETKTDKLILWAKIIFSGLFCIAALIVVLSNKYNDDTKKWAFSVLTLIAGVWIGTAT